MRHGNSNNHGNAAVDRGRRLVYDTLRHLPAGLIANIVSSVAISLNTFDMTVHPIYGEAGPPMRAGQPTLKRLTLEMSRTTHFGKDLRRTTLVVSIQDKWCRNDSIKISSGVERRNLGGHHKRRGM